MAQRGRHGRMRGSKPKHSNRPKSYRIVCASCGKEVVGQVAPPEGKVVMEGDQVMGAEADIDNVSKFLNCVVKKRLRWYKGEGMGGCEVQNPDVQADLNPIKLCVRVAAKR